jgi:glycerophosphoryl diester phosphodiesterase
MKYNINDLLKNQHIAHRGCWDDKIPENSIDAFIKAINMGLDIELDAHLLKDGSFAIFHDFTLSRMCGKKIFISSQSKEKLSKYRLNNTTQQIPLLTDVLDLTSGKATLFLEVKVFFKWKKYAKALCKAIENYDGAIVLHGFNRKVLRYLQINTRYPVAVLSFKPKKWKGSFIPDALTTKLDCLPVQENERNEYPPFISWTINNEADREKAEKCSNAFFSNIKNINLDKKV